MLWSAPYTTGAKILRKHIQLADICKAIKIMCLASQRLDRLTMHLATAGLKFAMLTIP